MIVKDTYKFWLLKIIVYSLLSISVLLIVFIVYSGAKLNQMIGNNQTIAFFSGFFCFVLIVNLFFVLRRKLWAYYLLYLQFGFLLVVIFFQDPVDWLNAIILVLLVVVFAYSHRKLVQIRKNTATIDQNSEADPNKEE